MTPHETIYLNSRARKPPFGAWLARGVVNLSPLVLIFATGYFSTLAVFKLIECIML